MAVTYLFISHSGHLHGAELSLTALVSILKARESCEVHVVLPFDDANSRMEQQLRANGCEVHHLTYAHTRWVDSHFDYPRGTWESLALVPRFIRLLQKLKPDVVVLNSAVLSPLFAVAARLVGIPCVWSVRELGAEDHGYRFLFGRRATIALMQRFAHHLVFNSAFTKSRYRLGRQTRSSVIPPPCLPSVDERPAETEDQRDWSLVLLGRTVEGKGQFDAIRAMDILVNRLGRSDVHLTVVGVVPNAYSASMQEFVERTQLAPHVTWIPFGDAVQAQDHLRRAHVGLVTSRHEAFGRVTVEYLVAGLLTVGADAGGTSEILDHFPRSTVRYRPGDHEDLARVLDSLMRQPYASYRPHLNDQMRVGRDLFSAERQYRMWKEVFAAATASS
ncbi:MAG: hypothetical protein RLZZ63_329 [Gemmatimonadota bacterium]